MYSPINCNLVVLFLSQLCAVIHAHYLDKGTVDYNSCYLYAVLYRRHTVHSYANLSLLFARYHAKIIYWGHESPDFVALGFQGSDEDGYENDDEE